MEIRHFKKYFTVREAHQTLPLVKRIVRDILDTGHQIRSLSMMLSEKDEPVLEIRNLYTDLEENLAELEDIGCFYKDWNFSIGLVDFPAVIEGREVFLCWRSDEENIAYFHAMDAGYDGRRKIPEPEN